MRFGTDRILRSTAAIVCALLLAAAPAPRAVRDLAGSAQAHPALWTVHGPKGTAYLLGSIHVLPPQMHWRTPQIDAALKSADVFVFEIPMGDTQKTEIQEFIKQNGMLPPGMALPSLLTADVRKDYAAALDLTHVPPELLTPMRPWLALLMLDAGRVTQQHLSIESGLDKQVYAFAVKRGGDTFKALETPEQQLRLLMPEDQSLEIQEFDAGLKELLNETLSVNDLIAAWAAGDVRKLNDLMNSGFKENPKAEKTLFDDRNRAWVAQLESMLKQRHANFITVGAGHLVGTKGVPALLRADGYKVEGP
jgi:uncharacterized protein YbaP (TraB family)